jgi:hypothetical protein
VPVRVTRASLEEAKAEAESAARSLALGYLDAGKDRLVYVRAITVLNPISVDVERAAKEYAEALGVC